MKEYGLHLPEDLKFIEEQIAGPLTTEAEDSFNSSQSSSSVSETVVCVCVCAHIDGEIYLYRSEVSAA